MRRAVTVGLVAMALAAGACSTTEGGQGDTVSAGPRPSWAGLPDDPRAGGFLGWLRPPAEGAAADQPGAPVPEPATTTTTLPPGPPNYLAHTMGQVSPALADMPVRVYVPNSDAHTLTVIDPATFEVVARYSTSWVPHHVTPSWDMTKLYINNTEGNQLTVLDPRTSKPVETLDIIDPYNLYFTPDGTKAIVVAERLQRLDYRDPHTWELIKSVKIPGAGVDHMDFTHDGRYLIASTEFSGHIVKVDNEKMEVADYIHVGGLPIDVKMSPDGSVFYVTNQGTHGVHVIDPDTMKELAFIATDRGAHGLNYSRDTKRLFVSNRLAGSISVIDPVRNEVTATWKVGGSPDMLQVSTDGSQIWVSNRFHGSVSVIDTNDGSVIKVIPTGAGAHGVAFYPQPGRFSVGHNGVYR
jgi:YVTN family beta-propeller protein